MILLTSTQPKVVRHCKRPGGAVGLVQTRLPPCPLFSVISPGSASALSPSCARRLGMNPCGATLSQRAGVIG